METVQPRRAATDESKGACKHFLSFRACCHMALHCMVLPLPPETSRATDMYQPLSLPRAQDRIKSSPECSARRVIRFSASYLNMVIHLCRNPPLLFRHCDHTWVETKNASCQQKLPIDNVAARQPIHAKVPRPRIVDRARVSAMVALGLRGFQMITHEPPSSRHGQWVKTRSLRRPSGGADIKLDWKTI